MRREIASAEADLRGALGRDLGEPSARTSSKGALLSETMAVFRAIAGGMSEGAVKEKCLSGMLLRNSARLT